MNVRIKNGGLAISCTNLECDNKSKIIYLMNGICIGTLDLTVCRLKYINTINDVKYYEITSEI